MYNLSQLTCSGKSRRLPRLHFAPSKVNVASWQVNSIGDAVCRLSILHISWKARDSIIGILHVLWS